MMLNQWNDCFALQQDRYERSMIRYGAQLPKQELYLGIPKVKQDFTTVLYFHGGGLTGDGIEMPPRLIDGDHAVIAARYRVSDGSNTALDARRRDRHSVGDGTYFGIWRKSAQNLHRRNQCRRMAGGNGRHESRFARKRRIRQPFSRGNHVRLRTDGDTFHRQSGSAL